MTSYAKNAFLFATIVAMGGFLFRSVYANIDDNLKFKLGFRNRFLKRPYFPSKFTRSGLEMLRLSPIPSNCISTAEFK